MQTKDRGPRRASLAPAGVHVQRRDREETQSHQSAATSYQPTGKRTREAGVTLSCGLSVELQCSEGLELLSMFCSVQGSQMVPVSPGDGGLQDQAPGPWGTSCLRPTGPPVAPARCCKKRLGDGPVGITQPLSLHPEPRPSPGCLKAEPRSPGAPGLGGGRGWALACRLFVSVL